jgi:ATP-dependent Lon protease
MKNTIQYSQDAVNKFDMNKISLEQQIILLRVNNNIKDRAIAKLKEIKGKPDDQGSKAKQYLEGLLKIPFGVYKEEPVLKKMNELNDEYSEIIKNAGDEPSLRKRHTALEMSKKINDFIKKNEISLRNILESELISKSKHELIDNINSISNIVVKNKSKSEMVKCLKDYANINNKEYDILKKLSVNNETIKNRGDLIAFKQKIDSVGLSMKNITNTLDDSIYGHKHAKDQILKIIAQWINGEKGGYCFGFEGSPGVGKTSLAKRGLSKCLIDEDGKPRPFSFIALGGSTNGSTLEGHNYTYVNSTWGKIVDVLMETKCMNPIIYIDELDKVSNTEQGKEIIGILTHMIDSTQNDEFQDKYFNGIQIDLSKALFVFSYNDPDKIDRILLDRIHRVKFDNLSWLDKMVIVKKFILPEINKKMGFDGIVELSDEAIRKIIDEYTTEPGIRKLKEILFDLYGEININLLRGEVEGVSMEFPIIISSEDLGKKYIKKCKKINDIVVHSKPKVGVISGLWANMLGKGGIIPIETSFFPSSTFLDLKLTGMQGDVMKESMNVAKTLAWSLTSSDRQKALLKNFEETQNQGLHIHCPEGAVSKDGPSAGAAITIAIYSLLNNIKINNKCAITGEITLQGNITAIGGLDSKIVGGIRAGIETFLYPTSNVSDYEDYVSKYADTMKDKNIRFISVSTIEEALSKILCKE